MAGPSYIIIRDSDGRVMDATTTSLGTPPAGHTEYYETHPVFDPLWTIAVWTRTAPSTYSLGTMIDDILAEDHTVQITTNDTKPDFLLNKLVEGTAIDLTKVISGTIETLRVDVDINELTEDTIPDPSSDFLLSYDTSTSSHKKVRINNFAGADEHISLCDCTGSLTLTSSFNDIAWDTEHVKTSGFTHSANSAIVTANFTGFVLISGHFTTETSSRSGDNTAETQLLENTGSGYVAIPGTALRISNDQVNADDSNTSSFSIIRQVTSGTSFKLQAKRLTGTGTLVTVMGGSGLNFTTIGRGSQGPQGVTGSGSNITIRENNTNVTNTPHSILDFDGTHFDITDQGSGRALVKYVFGAEFQQASSDAESTTTATSLQTKLTLTTTSLPSATYMLNYSFEVSNGANSILTTVEIQEGATVEAQTTFEADNDYHSLSGFVIRSWSGVKTLTIKYMTASGGTAKIRRARLALWRVS